MIPVAPGHREERADRVRQMLARRGWRQVHYDASFERDGAHISHLLVTAAAGGSEAALLELDRLTAGRATVRWRVKMATRAARMWLADRLAALASWVAPRR